MNTASAAFLLLFPAALLVAAPRPAPTPPAVIEFADRFAWVLYPAATPLEKIPVYSLTPTAPQATKALEAEIERLYTHSKTLPIGHDRRAFQTRIYNLDKQLRPLLKSFDVAAWETLRSAVRSEWETIQTTLTPATPVAADQSAAAHGSTQSLASVTPAAGS